MKVYGTEEVIRNLDAWHANRVEAVTQIAQKSIAPRLEQYAKSNRPWTDRTGNARRGLTGYAYRTTDELVLGIAHSVYYGKYLELGYAGRFAILHPTMEQSRQMVLDSLRQAFFS